MHAVELGASVEEVMIDYIDVANVSSPMAPVEALMKSAQFGKTGILRIYVLVSVLQISMTFYMYPYTI